jgi:ribose transport system permease protein
MQQLSNPLDGRGLRLVLPSYGLAIGVVIVLAAINTALQPNFLLPWVFKSNIQTFLPLILIALGQSYVVLGGSIDLSLGALVSLINVCVVTMLNGEATTGPQLALGIAAAFAIGAGGGLFNGILLGVLRLQPIVTTFATSVLFGGVALWIMPQAGGMMPVVYYETYFAEWFGISPPLLVLIFAILVAFLISRSRFHIHLLAVGANRTAAFQAGIPVLRVRILSHVVAGLFAAVATLCLLGETAAGDPLMGQAFTLSSVSAVVLGGVALSGGTGLFVGAAFGAAALGLINNVLFFAQLPFVYQSVVQGVIILLALAGGVLVSRR